MLHRAKRKHITRTNLLLWQPHKKSAQRHRNCCATRHGHVGRRLCSWLRRCFSPTSSWMCFLQSKTCSSPHADGIQLHSALCRDQRHSSMYSFFFLIFAGIILDKMGVRFTAVLSGVVMVIGAAINWYALTDAFLGSSLEEWFTTHLNYIPGFDELGISPFYEGMPASAKLSAVGFMIFRMRLRNGGHHSEPRHREMVQRGGRWLLPWVQRWRLPVLALPHV